MRCLRALLVPGLVCGLAACGGSTTHPQASSLAALVKRDVHQLHRLAFTSTRKVGRVSGTSSGATYHVSISWTPQVAAGTRADLAELEAYRPQTAREARAKPDFVRTFELGLKEMRALARFRRHGGSDFRAIERISRLDIAAFTAGAKALGVEPRSLSPWVHASSGGWTGYGKSAMRSAPLRVLPSCGYVSTGERWRVSVTPRSLCPAARNLVVAFASLPACRRLANHPSGSCAVRGYSCAQFPHGGFGGTDVWCANGLRQVWAHAAGAPTGKGSRACTRGLTTVTRDPRRLLPLAANPIGPASKAALRFAGSGKPRVVRADLATADRERGGEARFDCGTRVWRRTVVVYVTRRAYGKSASLSESVLFVGRFRDGYRVWQVVH